MLANYGHVRTYCHVLSTSFYVMSCLDVVLFTQSNDKGLEVEDNAWSRGLRHCPASTTWCICIYVEMPRKQFRLQFQVFRRRRARHTLGPRRLRCKLLRQAIRHNSDSKWSSLSVWHSLTTAAQHSWAIVVS